MKLLKPENLELETLFKPDQLYSYKTYTRGKAGYAFKKGTSVTKLIPYMYFFINQIIITEASKGNYTKGLKRITGNDVKHELPYKKQQQVLHLLINSKIIKRKTVTEIGTEYPIKAKYYCLCEEYNTDFIEVNIVFKDKKKSRVFIDTFTRRKLEKVTTYYTQFEIYKNYSFNHKAALEYIDVLLADKKLTRVKYIKCQQHIRRLVNHDIQFSISEKNGRISSLITSCPREIRKFFLSDAYELDYQSFYINVLIHMLDSHITINNIDKLQPEIDRLITEVNSELGFYTSLAEKLKVVEMNIDRDTCKLYVMKYWLFAYNTCTHLFYASMKTLYPEITKVMETLKGTTKLSKLQYCNNYMRFESELINNIVFKTFINKYPDARVYTIYDGLLVESKYKDILYDIMVDEAKLYFERQINVKLKEK